MWEIQRWALSALVASQLLSVEDQNHTFGVSFAEPQHCHFNPLMKEANAPSKTQKVDNFPQIRRNFTSWVTKRIAIY
jgi:hypothetical protein